MHRLRRPPDDLYKNGLQRSLFTPFLPILKSATEIHSLYDSETDYRLVKSIQKADVSIHY